jgi:hypothetical protein
MLEILELPSEPAINKKARASFLSYRNLPGVIGDKVEPNNRKIAIAKRKFQYQTIAES